MARLVIHATDQRRTTETAFSQRIRSFLAWRPPCRSPGERAGLRLAIEDSRGRPAFTLDDAGPLVEVSLPAGVYHVIAHSGGVRRDYSLALEQGASVDLYLAFAADR